MAGKAVIIDSGSGRLKAGLSDDFGSMVSFPTIVGKATNPNLMIGMDQKDFYVGNEAKSKRELLTVSSPVNRGFVEDWQKMEQIWQYTFENELVVDSSEFPLMVCEPPSSSKAYKEKMAEVFFETFKCEKYYLSVTAVLALLATGKVTGLVLESGEGVTHSVPVFEGVSIPFATIKLELGGGDLTQYLMSLFREEGFNIPGDTSLENFVKLKEKKCSISEDFDASVKDYQKTRKREPAGTLPDGTELVLTDQHFKCPEILFQPNKLNREGLCGIHEAICNSIKKCSLPIQKDLYASILLAGGNTLFPNINKRLFKEISALAASTIAIKTKAPQDRLSSVFIGGSILSSLESFTDMWVTAKEYRDYGPSILHKKIV